MIKSLFSNSFVLALLVAGLTMTGCKSVPVDITSMTAPDSLQTNQNGTFVIETNADAKLPVAVSWDFGDEGSADGSSATHSFNSAGTYTVTATATNRKGKSVDMSSATVVVVNPPVPAQIVSIRASNNSPDTETAVTFSASVNGDTPVSYSWNFGDGASSSDASPSHTFAEPGTYTVQLNASNRAGSDSRSMSITVDWYEAAICREVTELSSAFFDRNSSQLSDEGEAALRDNLEILSECPNMNVRVEGVSAPGERRPQELSEDRARAVEQFYADNGVPANRMVTMGNGRAEGLTSKKEGLAQYRRVDTIIVR
ncbi:MAG: PKD domain-containing protein [Bacteroidota bacterium]|nr:PKD domain-containing protein [Bacteroidota bacterium]